MTTLPVKITAMTPGDLGELRALMARPLNNWCWCVAWEVGDWPRWPERSAEENRALRESLWAEGEMPFFLIRCGDVVAGWIKASRIATWPALCRLSGREVDDTDWAIACVSLEPEWRGRGVMREAVRQLPALAFQAGAQTLHGFPLAEESREEPGSAWMLPKALFLDLGFEVTKTGERRDHACLALVPGS